MSKAPHVQAAFINTLAEEGTRGELVKYLQEQWNETCAAQAEIKLLLTQSTADGETIARLTAELHHAKTHVDPEVSSAVLDLVEEVRKLRAERDAAEARVKVLEDAGRLVSYWFQSCLGCHDYPWDADQRKLAIEALEDFRAALTKGAAT